MRWYILRIKTRKAAKIVDRIGLENCWLPLKKRWTRPAKKNSPILVEVNLIPGWLFVKEDQFGQWTGLDGVHGYMRYGRMGPLWIEDEDLDGLREICNEDPGSGMPLSRRVKAPVWRPKVGDKVELKGLFKGLMGIVTEVRSANEYLIDTGNLPILTDLELLKPLKS